MKFIIPIIYALLVINTTIASDFVIWKQELDCVLNSTCRPGELLADSTRNQVIIVGTSDLLDKKETTCWAWVIDPNGVVRNKKSEGMLSEYDSFMAGPFGIKAAIKPDTGDVVRLKLDDTKNTSFSITERNMQSRTAKLNPTSRTTEYVVWLAITYCPDNMLLVVGKDPNDNGILINTDLDGSVMWEKSFDYGQTEILSSATCASDGSGFYIAGLSASPSGRMSVADAATVYVLYYDNNGRLKASTFFDGGVAPWPSSLPKVVCLSSGAVLVVYDKSVNAKSTNLYMRAYTPDLDLLYEKQVLSTKEDGPPAPFDLCALPEDRFVVVGNVNYWDLHILEYEADGTILQTINLSGEVGPGRVYVDYLAGQIIVASANKLKENEKEIKIKLLAIKPLK